MVDKRTINESIVETITIEDEDEPIVNETTPQTNGTRNNNNNQLDPNTSSSSEISSLANCSDSEQVHNETENTEKQQQPTATTTNPKPVSSQKDTPEFTFGPYVPIFRKDNDIFIDPKGIINSYYENHPNPMNKRLVCEILPDDTIVDTPSFIAPLMLKKKTKLPVIKSTSSDQLLNDNRSSENNNLTQPPPSDFQVLRNILQTSQPNPDLNVNRKTVEDYIRETCVTNLTSFKRTGVEPTVSTLKDYYKSSAGELLLGIGLSRVTEFQLQNNVGRLARKIRSANGNCNTSDLELLEVFREQLQQAKSFNKVYKPDNVLTCPRCPFKTESSIVMSGHLETPHVKKRNFLCNWCDYKNTDSPSVVYHCLVKHKQRCRIEKPPAPHLCRFCPFEHKEKRRWRNHLGRCEQLFELNKSFLGPQDYEENNYPGVTSKLIDREDIRVYESRLKAMRLAAYNPHQIKISSLPQGCNPPIVVVSRQNGQFPANVVGGARFVPLNGATVNALAQVRNKSHCGNAATMESQNNHSVQLMQILSGQNPNTNQTRNGILQYPRTQSPFMNASSALRTATDFVMGPQNANRPDDATNQIVNINDLALRISEGEQPQNQSTAAAKTSAPNPKGSTFVICEICDGYIKDLGQLKSHMQWTHKVKIHQKMLVSSPPLNCQKCQWRFFTDQGLERHLLGAHGLVTSNMQELVNKCCDSGRCTICGRAHANKLVAHMKEVHKLTLRPAHLTYKCTVCSATFNLYRLFENHVYSVHSESMRHVATN